ncbi:MAG: glycosyltransferase family 2 protein [Bacteroidota bacterium]|nr:glycosyltransferase family 2 protein [Bacteroidota bacterium]
MENNPAKPSDLSIIILNYNGQAWLETLLPSLKHNYLDKTRYKVDVIAVDNASTDTSVDYLNALSWIKLITSPINGGFAYGNNLAIKTVTSRYFLLLNSDTEIPNAGGNLDVLIDYMDQYRQAGIITPKVLLSHGKLDLACHRGEPTPWASFTYFSKLDRLFPHVHCLGHYHQSWKKLDEIHSIDACTGAAMLVRTAAVKTVGLLDERFFMYAEDIDWCKRFREAGFSIIFHPGAELVHHKYKSGMNQGEQLIQSKTHAWFYKTMLQYYDKHYAAHYPACFRHLLKRFVEIKIS